MEAFYIYRKFLSLEHRIPIRYATAYRCGGRELAASNLLPKAFGTKKVFRNGNLYSFISNCVDF
jgi:hypothetical protein